MSVKAECPKISVDGLIVKLIGVVLCGGKSSRMGVNKSTLIIKNTNELLIEKNLKTLEQLGCSQILISGNINNYPKEPTQVKSKIVTVIDLVQDFGPLGGIISVINYLQQTSSLADGRCVTLILFLPVDLPIIQTPTLAKLIGAIKNKSLDGAIYNKHPLPLILQYTPSLLKIINDMKVNFRQNTDKKNLSVGRFLADINIVKIDADDFDNQGLTNTNTPQEWKEATGEYPY